MTTSGQMEFLSEILEWEPVPQDTLMYFRERLRHRLHATILEAFSRRARERNLKQSNLAIRIHRKRAQIARWLSTQSNLTLDSISDLMVGLAMDFDAFPFTPIENTIVTAEQRAAQIALEATVKGIVNKLASKWKLSPQWMQLVSSPAEQTQTSRMATSLSSPPVPKGGASLITAETMQQQAGAGGARILDLVAFAEQKAEERKAHQSQDMQPRIGVGR